MVMLKAKTPTDLTQLAAISLKNKKNWIEIQFFRGKTGDISCYYHVNC